MLLFVTPVIQSGLSSQSILTNSLLLVMDTFADSVSGLTCVYQESNWLCIKNDQTSTIVTTGAAGIFLQRRLASSAHRSLQVRSSLMLWNCKKKKEKKED